MCEQLEINSAEFSAQYQDSTGRTLPCFELDRYHTEVLVTSYDGTALPRNGGAGIRVPERSNHLEDGGFRSLAHLNSKSMW